jgi:hypothetical protein
VISSINLNVGAPAATLSVQPGYTFYYDIFVSSTQTIKVSNSTDASAILYSVS